MYCHASGGAEHTGPDSADTAVTFDLVLFSVSQVTAEGTLIESTLPLTALLSRAPISGPDVERVSTGTKFALELWLKTLETPDL